MFYFPSGRHTKENIQRYIKLDTIVRNVTYDKTKDIFSVTTSNLSSNQQLDTSTFSHVIVSSGHFSYPNIPKFDGLNDFPGPVIHSHDFKDAKAFNGQRILIIGNFLFNLYLFLSNFSEWGLHQLQIYHFKVSKILINKS